MIEGVKEKVAGRFIPRERGLTLGLRYVAMPGPLSGALHKSPCARSLASVISRRRPEPLALGASIAALLTRAAIARSDGGHSHGPEASGPVPLSVWLVGIGLTIVVALVVVRQARHGGEYLRRIQGFSRNARLLLIRTPFSGLSVSIWRLLFYLYLLAKGHDTLFVAQLASINWIAHGLAVIPAGILSDLFGRRRVFLVAYAGNIVGTAALIVVGEPTALLALAAVQGLFEGGHAIVGPPFMVEQSRPDERVHLFSIGGRPTPGAARPARGPAARPCAHGGLPEVPRRALSRPDRAGARRGDSGDHVRRGHHPHRRRVSQQGADRSHLQPLLHGDREGPRAGHDQRCHARVQRVPDGGGRVDRGTLHGRRQLGDALLPGRRGLRADVRRLLPLLRPRRVSARGRRAVRLGVTREVDAHGALDQAQ